ncbi:nitrous oxide reductase accessory protein NosL, partial [Pseudomonas aeruginosa]|nr:nitrous oxide reductase accessory protein NosL [Pseudomonas aeruginosa]
SAPHPNPRAPNRPAGVHTPGAGADSPPAPRRPRAAPRARPIEEFERVAQIWVKGEARVRHYASPESALADLAELKAQGKAIRAIYAQDRDSGIKLLANQAWFVRDGEGRLNAFLLREQAQDYARRHGGEVRDFAAASQQALALR